MLRSGNELTILRRFLFVDKLMNPPVRQCELKILHTRIDDLCAVYPDRSCCRLDDQLTLRRSLVLEKNTDWCGSVDVAAVVGQFAGFLVDFENGECA